MNRGSSHASGSTQGIKQCIINAKSGDPAQLWDLYFELTPSSCTTDVARIILSHLNPDLVPSTHDREHEQSPHKTYAERALPCVTAVAMVSAACHTRPSFGATTIPLLVEAVDGICLWMGFLLRFGLAYPNRLLPGEDFREAYFIHCQLLFDMVETDKRLSNAILSSPTFIDLLLRCWVVEGKGEEVFMKIDLDSASACPILDLMLLTTENDAGVELLIHQILSRPSGFAVHFARALIARARRLIHLKTPPTKSLGYVQGILRITEKLLSLSPALRHCFLKVNYLTELALVLNSVSADASQTAHPMKFMNHTIGSVMKLTPLIMEETPRAVHNWRDIIAGNYYAILVRALAHVAPQDYSTENLYTQLLDIFGIYAIYPCLIKPLQTARIPEVSMKRLAQDPRFKQKWDALQSGVRERIHVYHEMPQGFSICDNLSCTRSRKGSPTKQCSRCSSVVYCSEGCQKADWKSRHRLECDLANVDRAHCRAGNVVYSHTTRTFHTYFIEWMYNSHWSYLRQTAKQMYPSLSLNQWFVIIRTHGMQFQTGLEPLALLSRNNPHYLKAHGNEEVWWERSKSDIFDQEYLKPRVKEILNEYKLGKLKGALGVKGAGEVAVAEGVFQMGKAYSVYLTVPLKRASPTAKWEAAYSVPRYAAHPKYAGNAMARS